MRSSRDVESTVSITLCRPYPGRVARMGRSSSCQRLNCAARCSARALARAFACLRLPTKTSTPSTMQTSRKPQKNETPVPIPPNGSAISWTMPKPIRIATTIARTSSRMPGDPARDARARRRGDHAHDAQREQLAAGRRRLAELLGGHLQVARAALGERQRGLGHAAQLEPLLRPGRGDRDAEVLPRALGVHALGGARAEDRLRGGLEAGLRLQLLVGAGLELLHRGERATLLHLDLSRLGHGVRPVYERRRKPVGSRSGSSGLGARPVSGNSGQS